MLSDYKKIGKELLDELEIDTTRLGGALSTLNKMARSCLESDASNKVPMYCESVYELCDGIQGAEDLSNVNDPAHAEGIFHAYEGISHLYQAEEAKKNRNLYEESKELAKAIHSLEKSRESFHGEYRDQWNEATLWLSLGRLYRSQNRLDDALLAFERSCTFSNFDRLSIERMQEIVKVASREVEKTRMLFRGLPVISEIAAGKEKPASDDIRGYMRQTDELEFEFEGQALKAELLRGSQLRFLPEYDYFAVQVSGNSMDKAGIASNNHVILQKPKFASLEPSSRDIVAVVFRDEDDKAILKRLVFDKSLGSVRLISESSNPAHKTRVLRPEAFAGDNPSVEVVGIAIAVLKP